MMQSKESQRISDNAHLSRYREDMSSKQKLIRERLGLEQPNRKIYESSSSRLDRGSIQSIDGDTYTTEQMTSHERSLNYRSSFFNDDAEQSLQFFKANLLPRSQQNLQSNEYEKRPSKNDDRRKDPSSSDRVSTQMLDGNEVKPRPRNNRVDLLRQTSVPVVKSPPITPRPLPIKQTSLVEPRVERSRHDTGPSLSSTVRELPRRPTKVPAQEPHHHQQQHQDYESTSKLMTNDSSSRHILDRPKSASRDPDQERIETTRNHQTAPKEVSTSVRRSPEPFSRKPLYNSLLRAHDSIRLKVNRPKVRPKYESKVEDAVVVDDGLLPIENDPSQREKNLNDNNDDGQHIDMPVDVDGGFRWGSKRKSKNKKNKTPKIQEDQLPVRNFTDLRVVKIFRTENERSLGVTVRAEDGNIVVARIMAGSLADKQGVLQVGDIILTVNNREVYTPEQLQAELRRTITDDVVLMKIAPSFREELPTLCIYLRALFNYDPNEDSLLPCKEVGVAFNQGDILEVVNQEDPNWWQARRVESEDLHTGLIPSQELEERRRAFVLPDYDLATKTSICGTRVTRKNKKKEIYNIGQNNDFDRAELQLYEEVCRTPPFERRTLVLIGANGVGKQVLKARLLSIDPDRFGSPLAHTSRLPRDGEEDGVHYHFVTRETMEEDIIDGKYLEYGEYDGALYGTKLDSVREIIGSGKICVLDCSPTCLKILKSPDYLPFVAFIAAPSLDQFRYMQGDYFRGSMRGHYSTFDRALSRQSRRAKTLQDFALDFFEDEDLQVAIEESARLFRVYEKYFDIVLVNSHCDRTYEQLRDSIDALSMAPQWIPISWIYGN